MKIPNISHTKITTIETFTIPLIDYIRDITIIFMFKFVEMNRKGLKVLNNLNIFIAPKLITPFKAISIKLTKQIIKSKIDQLSRRYEFSSKINP